MSDTVNIFWFRRDLRFEDNVGLYHALQSELPVVPIFIFDKDILDKLPEDDARVNFIHEQLQEMRKTLQDNHGSSIAIYHGKPIEIWKDLINEFKIDTVFTNHDYEPYALERDEQIDQLLAQHNIDFKTFKDQVVYEKSEVVKGDGDPYVVYTPYKNKWLEHFRADFGENGDLKQYPSEKHLANCIEHSRLSNYSLSDIGFKKSSIEIPSYNVSKELISNYEKTRNFPAKDEGTSRLGIHLRFGTVSVRAMVLKADKSDEKTFLSELIWREFFMQILYHFPHTKDKSFKSKYDRIDWINDESQFEKWKTGKTGYELVDAGMRELNETGNMHNRVRMLVASFLIKHLLIDWRWGEAYFAEKLLDYEMSSNVGNWQWAAGSGVDAAPYFRIFNPITQVDKFDKSRKYVKQYVPEVDTDKYPDMIVDHKEARERCLKTYKEAVQ